LPRRTSKKSVIRVYLNAGFAMNSSPRDSASGSQFDVVLVWLAAIACFCATVAFYWPGFLSPDSLAQLSMARTGRFDDWHPPLMSAIWRPLDRAFPGSASMLVLQGALFWAGCGALIQGLARWRWRAALLAVPLALPPVFALLGTIWKDVLFASLLLCCLAGLSRERPSRGLLFALPLGLAACVALRYNAFAAVLPLCFPWARAFRREVSSRRSTGTVAAACALMIVGLASFSSRLLTAHRSYAEQAIWLHDLAAISLAENEVLFPDYLVHREPPATLEAIAASFDPLAADPLLYGPLRPMTGDARLRGRLFRAWGKAILLHPIAYAKHRAHLGLALLTHGPRTPETPFHWGIIPNPFGLSFRETPFRANMHAWFEWLAPTPVFAIWSWLALLLALAAGPALRRPLSDRDVLLLSLCASGLFYAASGVLLAPVTDFRYGWWVVLAALAALLLRFGASERAEGLSRRSYVSSP
jgi:hypothetical protein